MFCALRKLAAADTVGVVSYRRAEITTYYSNHKMFECLFYNKAFILHL